MDEVVLHSMLGAQGLQLRTSFSVVFIEREPGNEVIVEVLDYLEVAARVQVAPKVKDCEGIGARPIAA